MEGQDVPTVVYIGAALFGVVVGWIAYRTLRRSGEAVALSDIATVIGAVGGAAITGIFDDEKSFAWYSIGLFVGFFGYLLVSVKLNREDTVTWMGGRDGGGGAGALDDPHR